MPRAHIVARAAAPTAAQNASPKADASQQAAAARAAAARTAAAAAAHTARAAAAARTAVRTAAAPASTSVGGITLRDRLLFFSDATPDDKTLAVLAKLGHYVVYDESLSTKSLNDFIQRDVKAVWVTNNNASARAWLGIQLGDQSLTAGRHQFSVVAVHDKSPKKQWITDVDPAAVISVKKFSNIKAVDAEDVRFRVAQGHSW
jgi:hypothetical protein